MPDLSRENDAEASRQANRPGRVPRPLLVVGLVVGGLFVGIGLTEAALQLLSLPRLTYEFQVPFPGIEIELDRRVLFRFRPDPAISLNRLGYRDREFGPPREGRHRITVSGDSFVMGWNVTVDKTIPRFLEAELGAGHEVLNLGAIGYGPDQLLVRFEEEADRLRPEIAVLVVFPGNDFSDIEKNRLLEIDGSGALVHTRVNPVSERLPVFKLPLLVRKAFNGDFFPDDGGRMLGELFFADYLDFAMLRNDHTPAAVARKRLMGAIFRRFGEVAARVRAAFVVLIVPSFENTQDDRVLRERGIPRARYFRLEEITEALCETAGIRYLSLRNVFPAPDARALFGTDHHLSAHGNGIAARELGRFLARSGLVR